MESFIFSLNATLPVFFVIVLGWLLKRQEFITQPFCTVADKFVFKIALPLLLFKDIATTDLLACFNGRFVLFCMGVTTFMFFALWAGAHVFIKEKALIGAFTQASVRGSAAVLGIAFVENIYGSSGMAPLMVVSAVPLFNIFSVIILTFEAPTAESKKGVIKKAFLNILKNPIIWGIVAGIPFSLAGGYVPPMMLKTVSSIAATTTPLALLVVGASLANGSGLYKAKFTLVSAFIKLIALPALFLPFAVWLGFNGPEVVAILIMLGAPTTVTCYIMAKNMQGDAQLSASVILVSTAVSSLTLTLWLFLLRTLRLV
ncbi:MAG: AEC family transporter [Oscillospiraceae bacterium]|nr:AEC family transporter [Oscillospiraceae bacterium]